MDVVRRKTTLDTACGSYLPLAGAGMGISKDKERKMKRGECNIKSSQAHGRRPEEKQTEHLP